MAFWPLFRTIFLLSGFRYSFNKLTSFYTFILVLFTNSAAVRPLTRDI